MTLLIVRLFLIATILSVCAGCGTYFSRPYTLMFEERPYPATKFDAELIDDCIQDRFKNCFLSIPLAIIDLPFSLTIDTLLLPIDIFDKRTNPLFPKLKTVGHQTQENSFESAYLSLALAIDAPELCYRISPSAIRGGSNFLSGKEYRIVSTRAECFYTSAVQMGNIDLCKQVQTIYEESAYSQSNCEQEVNRNIQSGFQPGRTLGGADYELILRLLGYSEEDVLRIPDNKKDYFRLYLREKYKPNFRAKLTSLPDFSISDKTAKKELYSLVSECKTESNIPFCLKVNCALERGGHDEKCYTEK